MTPGGTSVEPVGVDDVLEVTVPATTLWTGPDAAREVDGPAVTGRCDVAAWAAGLDAEARAGLHGRTLSQLLLGESVRVVGERGDWAEVRALNQPSSADTAGYPGWVPRAHLGARVRREHGAGAFVVTPTAPCLTDDGDRLELSFGTALWVAAAGDDHAQVLLPGERQGRIPLEHVRLAHKRQQPTYGPDDILASAAQFLGLRYLWGGTSAWGLDCSGLVHLAYRAHGVVLPRDAFDQAELGRGVPGEAAYVEPVPLDEVRPGDLYFFARPGRRIYHVGFVSRPVQEDGTRWMLHAPESGEHDLVEDAPLAPHRTATLVAAGRVRKPDAGQLAGHAGPQPPPARPAR